MKRKIIVCLLMLFLLTFFGGCLAGADSSETSVEEYAVFYVKEYSFQGDWYDETEIRVYIPTREGAKIYFDELNVNRMYEFYGFFTEKDGQGMQATDTDGIFTEEFYQYCMENRYACPSIYPYAIPRDCVITLVSNCGVELEPIIAKCDRRVELPMEGFEKPGYTFDGWSDSPDAWVGSDAYTPQYTEVTLYGAFAAKFLTVHCYDYKGWTGHNTLRFDEEYTFTYRDETGYNFVGYFTEENGQGQQLTDRDGKGLTPWNIDENNKKVYAYYTPAETYTLTVPNNGVQSYIDICYMYYYGDGEEDYIRRTYGDGREIPFFEPKTTPKGYFFAGWCYDKGLSKPFYYTGTFSEDLTLYPKFVEIEDYDQRKKYNILNKEMTSTITLGWSQVRYGYYVSTFKGTLEIEYVLQCPYDDEAQFGVWNLTTNRGMHASWINNGEWGSVELNVNPGDIIRVEGYGAVNAAQSQIILYNLKSDQLSKGDAKVDIPDQFDFTVTQGSYFTLPVYEHLWYEFRGYYTEPQGGGQRLTNNQGKSLSRYEFNGPITAYAYYVRVEE